MSKLTRWCGVLVLVAFAGGCGGKSEREQLKEQEIATMNEAVDVLETIKDEESAKAAAPKLMEIAGRVKDLKKQQNALGKPSKDEQEKLNKKFDNDRKAAHDRLVHEMVRIQRIPGAPDALKDVIEEFIKLDQGQ